MLAVLFSLPHANDPAATLAFAAGFAIAAGVAAWIAMARRLLSRHRASGPRTR